MKIAIPTNDRETIAKRTGRAKEFALYHIKGKEIKSIEYLKNTHTHDDHDRTEGNHQEKQGDGKGQGGGKNQHEHEEHNHDELLFLLNDIDVLLVRAVGKYMRKTLKNGNITYQLVKIDDISKILENYLESLT
jgi:predicted Fe-Mo cluster-binding NifX family protein